MVEKEEGEIRERREEEIRGVDLNSDFFLFLEKKMRVCKNMRVRTEGCSTRTA